MRRCGAIAIRPADIFFSDGGEAATPRCLFGWPAAGGMIVLRDIPIRFDKSMEWTPWGPLKTQPDQQSCRESWRRQRRDEIENRSLDRFWSAFEELKNRETMEGVCHVLEKAGGQFYANVADCPEAMWFDLLDLV